MHKQIVQAQRNSQQHVWCSTLQGLEASLLCFWISNLPQSNYDIVRTSENVANSYLFDKLI